VRNPVSAYFKSYPFRDRGMLLIDSRAAFFFSIFNGLAIPLAGVVGRKLGMDAQALALLTSLTFVGSILNLLTGHLSDRGHRVGWVAWAGISSRAAVVLTGLATGPRGYLASMGTYNLANTLGSPAYSSVMRSNYSDAHRGRAMSDIRVLIQIVSAACAALAGWALDAAPWAFRIVFPIAGVAGILSSLQFMRVKDRGAPDRKARDPGAPPGGNALRRGSAGFRDSLRTLRGDTAFLVYMAIFFIVGMPDKLVSALEPIRLVDELGIDYAKAGLILGTLPIVTAILGYLALSRLSRRIDPFILLVACILLSAPRYLSFALATSPLHLVPMALLGGVANAGWDLLPLFTVMLFAKPERLSLYMGMHNALIGVRGIIGPAFGSWLYVSRHVEIASIYWVSFAISVSSAILLTVFIILRRSRGIRSNITR
jgi:MFS family permease